MWATADLHTHTIYRHGRGSIRENVLAAKQRGLHTIGMADHGPGHLFICVRGVEALHRMREEINGLQSEFPELEILLGVEANIVDVDGTIDVPEEILPELDYLLASLILFFGYKITDEDAAMYAREYAARLAAHRA